jgi:hypothetical protein
MSSSPPPGFDSRGLFCLWSQGDLKTAISDNHKTILHPLWAKEHFWVKAEGSSQKTLSWYRVLWSLGAYPLGIIGYAVDSALKTVLLIGNFFAFVIAFLSCRKHWRKERQIFLIDNLAATGIALIGILIPPLAYRLDKLAKKRMLARL